MDTNKCAICSLTLNCEDKAINTLGTKGAEGVNKASIARNSSVRVEAGQQVHFECRREHTRTFPSSTPKEPVKRTYSSRLTSEKFVFKEHCLFCGRSIHHREQKRTVRTTEFQHSIAAICDERNDTWADTVRGRIEYAQDLHAADAIYHQACSVNFRTHKNIPQAYLSDEPKAKQQKPIRSGELERAEAFENVLKYISENGDGVLTIKDAVSKMEYFLQDSGNQAYTTRYMKCKLVEHFGNQITITNTKGKTDVLTLKITACEILRDFYALKKGNDPEQEKIKVIEAAARLIQNDIKQLKTQDDNYPPSTSLSLDESTEFLPHSLSLLLQNVIQGKEKQLKVAAVGQAIVQASRPRSILAPLQLGLGIQLHHHFSSRFLIDTLHALGFCCSYTEILKYSRSAAMEQGTDLTCYEDGKCVQYVADNVDHNIRTLDGLGTFHGMGIIAAITPGSKQSKLIPRISVSSDDLAAIGRVNLTYYQMPDQTSRELIFRELPHAITNDSTELVDFLWKISLPVHFPRPGWSGMMQMVHNGSHPGKAAVTFLPLIDLQPSDPTCIYSTMLFVSKQAKMYNFTPVLTFDQPLWWKANAILEHEAANSELKSVVLRLGSFHMEMSFLGSIGYLMAGSGLQEILETIYAEQAVTHILSGKAVNRAVRGHMLVDAALNAILLEKVFDFHLPLETSSSNSLNEKHDGQTSSHTESSDERLHETGKLVKALLSKQCTVDDVNSDKNLLTVKTEFTEKTATLLQHCTAKIWTQYMRAIDILRKFIKAERTGNWKLHLQAVMDMLPYFAATGHNLYAKSAYLYLQSMLNLHNSNPAVYDMFLNGFHVIRRSDRYWAGLSSDLIIEQVLMKSIKTSGGLTRGKGMDETQRLIWIMSMPACVDVNEAMQDLTAVKYTTSDQHKEATNARQGRDMTDTQKIITFLKDRNPFDGGESLHNIATGVVASASVNADQAEEIGSAIICSMVGKNAFEYSFKRNRQVVNMSTSTVRVGKDMIQIDPQLLFQRLVAVWDQYPNPSELFKYELCSYPPALFDESGMLRAANKTQLADAIRLEMNGIHSEPPNPDASQVVIDGGALLQRIPWQRGATYNSICETYVQYVARHYGQNVTVVFDGYQEVPSTKDHTHLRRRSTGVGPEVKLKSHSVMSHRKDIFLSNHKNKQAFIKLLGTTLQHNGYKVQHARGDADLLIVQTATKCARDSDTVVIGDDTDLLVLLCYYADLHTPHNVYLKSQSKNNSKKEIWDIKQTKESLGKELCANILTLHALLGCDTTSRLFGLGKGTVIKKFRNNSNFSAAVCTLDQFPLSQCDVSKAGENALIALYTGCDTHALNDLRFQKFYEKVLGSTKACDPKVLPPTSAAAKYHSMRVYCQVLQWKNIPVEPTEWGWTVVDNILHPIQTDLNAAPKELLEIIRCKCKAGCVSKKCTCRKHGLLCSSACFQCKGVGCENGMQPESCGTEEDDI